MKNKHIILLLSFIAFLNYSFGQSKPVAAGVPAPVRAVNGYPDPWAMPGQPSFVRTYTAVAPVMDETSLITRPVEDVQVSTQYADGLGRNLQIVEKQSTPQKKDAVIPVLYDEYNRQRFSYLPYGSQYGDGLYKYSVYGEQWLMMQQAYDANNAGEKFYYSETEYERSPLDRELKSMPPGNSWIGSNRGTSLEYQINVAADNVVIWNVQPAPGSIPFSGGYYPAGQLTKSIATDENGNKIIEFKDKEGHLILRKTQAGAAEWLSIYYVYDNTNLLRTVLTPNAVKAISTDWSITANVLNEMCYRYEYDKNGNTVVKKLPGRDEVHIVYDINNMPVLMQDGNLRAEGKWFYTQYDKLKRVVSTGIWSNTTTREGHESAILNWSLAGYPFMEQALFTYPNINNEIEEYSRNYYDNYDWASVKPFDASYANKPQAGQNSYPELIIKSDETDGLLTGTKVRILGRNQYLITTNYYDKKERLIQSLADNLKGGTDITTLLYNFRGTILSSYLHHSNPAATVAGSTLSVGLTVDVLSRIEFDHSGRVLRQWKKMNDEAEKLIVSNTYDENGRLKEKALGQDPLNPSNPLETISYDYNIRGWLGGINKSFAENTSGSQGHFFGETISYDYGFSDPSQSLGGVQFNGNIAGIKWKSKGDNESRAYGYNYDAANRMLNADFTQLASNGWNTSAGVDFSVSGSPSTGNKISYDANGNIQSLYQKGLKINTSDFVDKLQYEYLAGGNRLGKVNDAVTGLPSAVTSDFKNGTNAAAADDYAYDKNGNIVRDDNKRLKNAASPGGTYPEQGIFYNRLNLPEKAIMDGKGVIEFLYDGQGDKLQKSSTTTGNSTEQRHTTDYISGFVYEDNVLQYMIFEEGKIRYSATSSQPGFVADYFIKDHVGNVRTVITDEKQQAVYPAATLEPSLITTESNYWQIDQNKIRLNSEANYLRDANQQPQTYPNNNGIPNNNPGCSGSLCTTDLSQRLYVLNGSTNKTGLGLTLKVMAGDRLDVFGKSYYYQNNVSGSNNSIPITDILFGLLGNGVPNVTAGTHGVVSVQDISTPAGILNFNSFFADQNAQNPSSQHPKAFINCIFFDEQFKVVGHRISIVGNNKDLKDHYTDLQNIEAPKNGYVYIYCSNESPVDVFFDNLQLVHTKGRIVSENHYYPFGLLADGISSSALNAQANNYKYNSKELERNEFGDGYGLDWYDYGSRMYDVQIARWTTTDPKEEQMRRWSPYAYSFNNPMRFIDPDGMMPGDGYGSMASNFNSYIRSMSPVNSTRNNQNMTEAEQAYAFAMQQITNKMAPVVSTVETIGEVAKGFVPFVDAAQEAMNGNWKTAIIFAGTDIVGGSIEKGIAKGVVKAGEKFLVKAAERQIVKEVERTAVKEGERLLVSEAEKALSSGGSRIWEVGAYKDMKGVEAGLDAHHVGQKAVMAKFIPDYNPNTAPTILVPKLGHTIGSGVVSRATSGFSGARQVVARDIFELRRVYGSQGIPNSALQELIQMNKTMFPGHF